MPDTILPDNPIVLPPAKGGIRFINNLPPELLSRIFEVGSADDAKDRDRDRDEEEEVTDDEADSDGTRSSSDLTRPWLPFPIITSHVCRHWRNVALSTPSLWTTIIVTARARPPYELKSTQLERSKGLPIDIHINCQPNEDSDVEAPSDADVSSLFSILIPHIHRWRTMQFEVSKYYHMHEFLDAISAPRISAAPHLTTLELYNYHKSPRFDGISMPKDVILFSGSAPLLTRLVLWGVHVDWDQPWIASAPNLVDLEFAWHPEHLRPSWSQFTTILRGASVLEKLTLRRSGPSGDFLTWFIEPTPGVLADVNAAVRLPRVTELVLAFHSQVRAIGLLRKLHLPLLKSLVLNFDKCDYTDFIRELARPAASATLTSGQERPRSSQGGLEPAGRRNIRTLYSELQNLTSLNLSLSWCLSRLFLDVLREPCTLTGRGDTWLPRLETLYVSKASGYTLRDVVQKRRDAGVPLSSLYVAESCEVSKEDVGWLRENVAAVVFRIFKGT